jgi:hypothetical protein
MQKVVSALCVLVPLLAGILYIACITEDTTTRNNLVELEYYEFEFAPVIGMSLNTIGMCHRKKVLIFRFTFGMQFVLFMAKLSVTISGLVSKPE